MSPTSPLFAVMIVLVALGFTNRLAAHTPPPDYKRFRTLDGLRGLAALAVVIHHSEVWYFFNATGHWLNPPSNFYTQCGQGGVTVFFVMTGFLFWDKIKPDGSYCVSCCSLVHKASGPRPNGPKHLYCVRNRPPTRKTTFR